MYVKDRMSNNPYCIEKGTSISKALDIMSTNDFHRLPVVENGKLVGLITEGTIADNTPSKATSLSMYELNYLLSKTSCADIMIKDVVTCSPNDLLEDAAYKMRTNSIGCLPVVDNGNVVGIITDNDVFDSFIDLLGYYQEGTRFVVVVKDDKKGVLEQISKLFFNAGAFISNLAVYHRSDETDVVIIASGVDQNDMVKTISDAGFQVSATPNNHKK